MDRNQVDFTESTRRDIENLMEQWDIQKGYLSSLFQRRNHLEANEPMNTSIDNFLSLLFLLNSRLVPSRMELFDEIKKLSYYPINCIERLDFIICKPNQFHSFIQLSQLYLEVSKQYQILLLKQRIKK